VLDVVSSVKSAACHCERCLSADTQLLDS
jgi:hypothetical protein